MHFKERRTIPAFINKFPYNDMLLDSKLQVNGFGVKTGNRKWSHRGLTLFYTSLTPVPLMEQEHGYDRRTGTLGAIIGCARLVDVRTLSRRQLEQMFRNFNPSASRKEAREFAESGFNEWGPARVIPLDIGYFFIDPVRFSEPVRFRKNGPVRFMNVPLNVVAKQLRRHGVNVD